jgi:hypothetical protein
VTILHFLWERGRLRMEARKDWKPQKDSCHPDMQVTAQVSVPDLLADSIGCQQQGFFGVIVLNVLFK